MFNIILIAVLIVLIVIAARRIIKKKGACSCCADCKGCSLYADEKKSCDKKNKLC